MTIAMPDGQGGNDQPPAGDSNKPAGLQPGTPPPPSVQAGASASDGQASNAPPLTVVEESQGEEQAELTEAQELEFPHEALTKLDEMISRPRWVVPVLPKGELEVLLDMTIAFAKKGLDEDCGPCLKFYADGLSISFTKILTDEAVSGWKFEIHRCIMENAKKLVELCVVKLNRDNLYLLELLAMVLNPNSKFHTYNGTRQSDTVPQGSNIADDELFARPSDSRNPKGWLVDLVNLFGSLGGFQVVLDRFIDNQSTLTVPIIAASVKPFGFCYEVLTAHTVEKYFMPILEIVPEFLDKLTDEELKKGSKSEVKNDALSSIVKALKYLASRVPKQEDKIKNLEMFRLKMILRLLQISSFNGKMNALNEVNKVITNVTYYPHRHGHLEEEEWLTADKMAEWIQQNNVLNTVLRDSLHQPQYVEKLEKIVRFMIKEKALDKKDLDKIWEAQAGKHEAIVKNVHDLLAKLAWDFSPEQLDHLFECFQQSWQHASKKQREKLLELIRRLAEDDKEGIMASKVLGLLWNLAHSDDVPTEIMDQALTAHIKILDYSASQDREAQKMQWINKFVEELKNEKWVLPALKQIREICQLFSEAPQNYSHSQRTSHIYYRNHVINQLQTQHSIVMLVAQNLNAYMSKMREYERDHPNEDPVAILPDGRFNHVQQVQERLKFLRFLLKDGQLWLCEPQAKQIWICLAVNAIYPCDRENCFKWFAKLMGEDPDLDPEILKEFMVQNILLLDPSLLTENGMTCFERFFKHVNIKEGKLIPKRRGGYFMDDQDLVGLDYLWRVVLYAPEDVSDKSTLLIREMFTNLGPRLQSSTVPIHEDFIQDCMDRLKAAYDTISALDKDKDSINRIEQEASRMVRVLSVLREYVLECDDLHGEERAILPLSRACRGKHLVVLIRFPNQNRQFEDIDIWSHQNDTVGSIRRQTIHRMKAANANLKLDLYHNNEIIDHTDDRKLVSMIGIKDKTLLTAKLTPAGTNMPSSPDSSSDSSTGGSPHHAYDGPNIEAEACLPGVLLSKRARNAQFLFQVYDLGSSLQMPRLRDCARSLLKLMPADVTTMEKLSKVCADHSKLKSRPAVSTVLEEIYFSSSPAQVLYALEVTYALMMPAQNPINDEAFEFQVNLLKSGIVSIALSMLTKNNFMSSADLPTKRAAYLTVLKICKLVLTTVGHGHIQVVADAFHQENPAISQLVHNQAVILQQAFHTIPHPSAEYMTRSVASKLGQHLAAEVTSVLPDSETVRAIMKIAWSASSGSLNLVHATNDEIHKEHEHALKSTKHVDTEDIQVCREALEVLTICLALYPTALETLNKDKAWQAFIIDVLLLCRSRSIRITGTEQFLLIATKCSQGPRPLLFFITLSFTVLLSTAKEYAAQSHEYFQLLCRLLNYACGSQAQFGTAEVMLQKEITWLKNVRESFIKNGNADVEEALLEGHLGVTKELLQFQSAEKKYNIGSEEGGAHLIRELVEDFIFPASKIVIQCRKTGGELPRDQAIPVCSTQLTIIAAFELLVALCTGCIQNLKCLAERLTLMYYSNTDIALSEWEYLPPIGPRPPKGFVGLKNAGATCYMNSLLQQLFMVDEIRSNILHVEGAADENMEDYDEDKPEIENTDITTEEEWKNKGGKNSERKEYHMGVLKHVQVIFAHLACGKLQYYVPRAFWKHFRLKDDEPVNLREQHDALEFFTSLVDSLDEALKALNYKPIFTKVMGGSFADQKICKGCPHRYSREESFMTLSIDIRNQHNLLESLDQYVKGDLLEGANAYHCEKCNKKVDTVKRMCIKKLPPMLAIQLKRFDYDWERECAIKFNDYFEFPREFDMEPYTAQGMAKIDGELISDENEDSDKHLDSQCTKYRLVGVVVHSGQASGGHYYSFILHRVQGTTEPRWYKFDDGEVSDCKMEDEEEMKNQCYGGEYLGEMYDHMTKRMSYRKQKRWWNAYILIYERMDADDEHRVKECTKSMQDLTIDNRTSQVKMPSSVERCVRKQNIQFMHNKNQFSLEYFQFMKKLLLCNQPYVQLIPGHEKLSPDSEELAMTSVQLASKFLFNICLHTKKNLRGSANDWYDSLSIHLRHSKNVRNWFALNVLFKHHTRFAEYLLECPSTEVRIAFMKIIVFIAHFSHHDGAFTLPTTFQPVEGTDANSTLSDYLLLAVLNLRKKEVSEHGRHLTQYFHLFFMYGNLGVQERQQLLRLDVAAMFMQVALDEGPGPPIKYQYAELGKLYSVVSLLVRCCDVSSRAQSSNPGQAMFANPHGDHTLSKLIMPIQPSVCEILFQRTSYVKKLLEDCNNTEETSKILKFCSWENPHFSSTVLSELLWQVAYSYTYELRPYLDLLLQMLMLEDSWQNHRIHNALKGIPDDRDGLFDTIQRSKSHYQKRAYQCIKMMVALFTHCGRAAQMLQTNSDLKKKWTYAVEWLHDELERRPYGTNSQYAYNNWSPPAQSNETSNGYFLERSHSARMTLAKAVELCPEEEGDEGIEESPDSPEQQQNEENSPQPRGSPTTPHTPRQTHSAPAFSTHESAGGTEQGFASPPNQQSSPQQHSLTEQTPPRNSPTQQHSSPKRSSPMELSSGKESPQPSEKSGVEASEAGSVDNAQTSDQSGVQQKCDSMQTSADSLQTNAETKDTETGEREAAQEQEDDEQVITSRSI